MTRDNARADQVETLRLAIYHAFADDGRAPVPDVLARQLGLPPAEIDADLHELARQRHVVLDPEGRIVMAHPFAAIPLGFAVMGAADALVGRLRVGLLRAAPPAAGQ